MNFHDLVALSSVTTHTAAQDMGEGKDDVKDEKAMNLDAFDVGPACLKHQRQEKEKDPPNTQLITATAGRGPIKLEQLIV